MIEEVVRRHRKAGAEEKDGFFKSLRVDPQKDLFLLDSYFFVEEGRKKKSKNK